MATSPLDAVFHGDDLGLETLELQDSATDEESSEWVKRQEELLYGKEARLATEVEPYWAVGYD